MLLHKNNLEDIKAEALRKIDDAAETFRLTKITKGSGQALEYDSSLSEAQRVLENPEIDPTIVPHIKMEADRRGVSLVDEANNVIGTATAWSEASAALKSARLGAKDAIRDATNPVTINAIVQNFINGLSG